MEVISSPVEEVELIPLVEEDTETQEYMDLLMDSASLSSGSVSLNTEKISLKDMNREPLFYKDDEIFDSPVLVRGTKKQLVPSESLVSFEIPSKGKFEDVLKACTAIDQAINLVTIENIGELTIKSIEDGAMILEHKMTSTLYVLEMPGDHVVLAFKQFGNLLGIPYAYSKKNPAFLNEANFQYWTEALDDIEDKQIPIDIVYAKKPMLVDLQTDTEGSTKMETFSAYQIISVIKSEIVRKGKGQIEVVKSALEDRVPIWSDLLTNVNAEIQKCDPDCEVKLQSYSLGYDGGNKGRHYSRLILDDKADPIEIGGQSFSLCLNIESDFAGGSSDFGATQFDIGLFREVCANGVGVVWNEVQREAIKHQYIINYMETEKIVESNKYYKKYLIRAENKFNATFSKTGIVVPNTVANRDLGNSQLQDLIKSLFESKPFIVGKIEELQVAFPEDMEEEKFVNTVLHVAQDLKLSPELTKFFILEFIAGNMTGEQKFNSPLDCLNYLTFMCKSYDSEAQMQVEREAYTFATTLAAVLIYKVKEKNEKYLRYKALVQEELIHAL